MVMEEICLMLRWLYLESLNKFSCGLDFKKEGELRDQYYDGEGYNSIICFGLVDHEWLRIEFEGVK